MTTSAAGNLNLKISRVREAFLEGRRRGTKRCTLSFEDFLSAFRSGRQSFAELAVRGGVSREAVRQIFEKYFKDLFPKQRHRWVRKARSRLKARRLRDSMRPPEDLYARRAYTAAKEYGLSVRQVRTENQPPGLFRKSELVIDGVRCAVHHVCSLHTTHNKTRGAYGRLAVTRSGLEKVGFNVVVVNVVGFRSRLYVVPSAVLLEGLKGSNHKTFFVPLRTSQHRRRPPVITWKVYEDAWFFVKSRLR